MDKFYVKPKKNLVSTNPSTSKATTTSRTSAEIFQSSSNGKRLGVGNICSKIRHKIEDNLTPKISSKLYKTGKHSKSLTALSSIGASSGKYTLTNKNSVGNETTSSDIRKVKLKANANLANSNEKPNPYAECYNTAKDISYFAKSSLTSYVDSDEDETQMSLNLAKTSLEDEIFQELEKASHDENKLNEVLKTFDKIIFDYNDPLVQEKSKLTIENESDNIKSEVDEIPNVKDSIENVLNSSIEIFNLPEPEFNNSTNIKSCCVKSEQTEIQLDNNASEFKKLEKSSSTLSLTRRKCYQSPNSPCLRQMRHAFAKQQRSKSVWELSNSSKIPILKAMPLKTRSKSFCYHDSEDSSNNLKSLENLKPLKTTKLLENTQTAATVQNAQKLRKQKSIDRKDRSLVSNASVKIKNETKTPNKTSTNVKTLQSKGISSKAKRTTSVPNINVASKTNMSSSVTRQIKKNDELLDKCLEKGQQILRKVESISTHRIQASSHGKKSVIRTKSNSSNKISKDNLTLKRKQWLHKLNYANEEKIVTPKLESCKIIPPVLGETSDKHAELLVQVTNATLLNTTRQRIITEEAQLKRTHNSTQQLNLTTKNHESDSDDSGHISNENMEIAINHTSHSSSSASLCETSSTSSANDSLVDNSESNGVVTKSLKMSEVLQEFERKSQMETTQVNSNENWIYAFEKSQSKSNKIFNIAANTVIPKTNISLTTAKDSVDSRFCTTYKVAEVESVSLIRTHVEIYPNYTKEILFRSGVLSELEAKRDELLSDRIIQLQAYCRGYLARKAMAQRRVQELAVRCIQRNVKAFLVVRDWPWWRLLVRVMPLLNVHRTEEQLKIANEELLTLRSKLERIENDRNELKTENQKLEAKNDLVVTQESERSEQMTASQTPETNTHSNNCNNNNNNNNSNNNNNNKTSRSINITNVTNTNNISKNKQTNNNDTQNKEHEQSSNLTFLERVRLAMRSSKASKLNTSVYGPLSKDGSNSSLSSNATNISSIASPPSTPSPRPPIPPKDPSRLRKQIKLIPKQRERSPAQSINKTSGYSKRSINYDSDDGLHLPSGITRSSCNGISNESETVVDSSNCDSSTVPVEAKLKLPLPKLDATSNSSSSCLTNGNYTRPSSDRLRLVTRSPSPALSVKSTSSRASSISSSAATSTTRSSFSRLQTPPRRIFPQTYTQGDQFDAYEMRNMEQSPVVFDANLSFVLGCRKQPVHQSFRPSPSFEDPRTASAFLSEKIQNFLKRTDHVQEEWTALGRRSRNRATASVTNSGRTTPTNSLYDDIDPLSETISLIERQRERNSMERCPSVGRSKSTQNILTKAFQLSKTLPRTPTSRSNSLARDISGMEDDDDDRTIQEGDDNELDELSEMTVDLAEERSTANMATERLEAETAERLRLEKELSEKENKVKSLQETTEKLEMELICAKSDLNGISEEEEDLDNEDGGSSGGVYKLKYERVAKELEFTKRRLQTQHEHDLEQLIGLKKQLEKKLSDAYEEVEEQRQVVGQWKRKAQKMTNEMNDLRMLLEEQNARNNLLEKKQRKFDSECQALQDTARQERQSKERLSRENDILIAEKFTLEQSLADTRLELDLKEEKLASLQRELEEMTFGGGTEEEIAQLRRSKNELDRRVKEQEEELDEMAGQVQLLEQAKLRLEMTLETMRKEARREAQQRDEELEEARGSAYKKIKALECQLETEHEERTLLLREKHELERRLSSMEDQDRVDRQAEEAANQKMRRDLRKYKALLKDAHAQLERLKADTPGKTLIRQLRNQLEDAESARTLAMKARQTAEAELAEVQAMYEESNRARNEAEDRANAAQRDRTELQAQIEENEEELAELMKKYSAAVKQLNTEQIAASEYEFKLSELEAERNNLKEQITELQHRLENIENLADPSAAMMSKRLELRTKELESRLELEQATRARLEVQVNRHKEALERLQNEVSQAKVRELQAQDALKKSQKSLRELREEFHVVSGREQESVTKRKDLEKKIEQVESESTALKNDLRLALQRIADLQQAMEEGDDDLTDSDDSQTSEGSLSDLEDRLKPIQVRRSSLQKQNGGSVSTTTTLVREKADNSPRITLTSPSSPHIHKMAVTATKLSDDPKQSSFTNTNEDSLKNGDVS